MSTNTILIILNVLYAHVNNIPSHLYQEIKLGAYILYDAICINMSHTHENHTIKERTIRYALCYLHCLTYAFSKIQLVVYYQFCVLIG